MLIDRKGVQGEGGGAQAARAQPPHPSVLFQV